MKTQVRAIARVQVTVEVEASAWGDDCSIGQLYKQAAESGLETVRNTLNKAGTPHRIVGEPKVLAVLTEK
jgi:hypothetical protein